MHLVGEGALPLAYRAGYSRCRLDVLDGEAPEWTLTGSPLERKYGLCLRPSRAASLPPQWQERCRPLASGAFRKLTLLAPGREDFLLSKLDPLDDGNREDISLLASGCVDRLELIRLFRALRRQHRGDPRVLDRSFNYVLREHFSLGPFRF